MVTLQDLPLTPSLLRRLTTHPTHVISAEDFRSSPPPPPMLTVHSFLSRHPRQVADHIASHRPRGRKRRRLPDLSEWTERICALRARIANELLCVMKAEECGLSNARDEPRGVSENLAPSTVIIPSAVTGEDFVSRFHPTVAVSSGGSSLDDLIIRSIGPPLPLLPGDSAPVGLPPGTVLELCGQSSTGKTQLVLSFAAHAVSSSVDGWSVFIIRSPDGMEGFIKRLGRMVRGAAASGGAGGTDENSSMLMDRLSKISIHSVSTAHEILPMIYDVWRRRTDDVVQKRLLLFDGLHVLLTPPLLSEGHSGLALVKDVALAIRRTAICHQFAVVVTNGVGRGDGNVVRPALGRGWASVADVRLVLEDPIREERRETRNPATMMRTLRARALRMEGRRQQNNCDEVAYFQIGKEGISDVDGDGQIIGESS